ncbi:hypothetical protein [Pseudalkalibacillus decolorationis]|nr:hypothetical protein [Pseudalkalibacillus decolorationis]
MMPFHIFILAVFKKVRSNRDALSVENDQRVRKLMDEAHDKSAQYLNLF